MIEVYSKTSIGFQVSTTETSKMGFLDKQGKNNRFGVNNKYVVCMITISGVM